MVIGYDYDMGLDEFMIFYYFLCLNKFRRFYPIISFLRLGIH